MGTCDARQTATGRDGLRAIVDGIACARVHACLHGDDDKGEEERRGAILDDDGALLDECGCETDLVACEAHGDEVNDREHQPARNMNMGIRVRVRLARSRGVRSTRRRSGAAHVTHAAIW
jgi:hypothetical protein